MYDYNKDNDLPVAKAARKLLEHTITKTNGFPKKRRYTTASWLLDKSKDIYLDIYRVNCEKGEARIEGLSQLIANCEQMNGLIRIAHYDSRNSDRQLSVRECVYWESLVQDVKSQLHKWRAFLNKNQ